MQIFLLIATGAVFDVILNALLKGRKVFPLSAMISCCSLAILLNWSYDFHFLFLPVFICIASKYVFTINGKHFFNPSLFAICVCLLFGGEYITLSPSYQWYGTADSSWFMMYFITTAALMLFIFKINRTWLILSFLVSYSALTIVRGIAMEHIIPFETLFIGSLTSPAFYLFTFYMITDPATSPKGKWAQICAGVSISVLDLLFHFKFSLYTFFFAGLTVSALRYFYFLSKSLVEERHFVLRFNWAKYCLLILFFLPVLWSFTTNIHSALDSDRLSMTLKEIPSSHSGLTGTKGSTIESIDPKLQHVSKWIMSVGDAAAVADVDLDGRIDLFLTQPLKDQADMAKLFINNGNFKFEKTSIPDLERYLNDPKANGIPGTALFMDYDNDGDKDLFVGFGFGKSHLFENRIIPDGIFSFKEVDVDFLTNENTVCLAANGLDANNDGKLDLLVANALHQYLPDYGDEKVPLNIFDLPKPRYEGDRRMFHFMHESWHNANNGGYNHLLLNSGDENNFTAVDMSVSLLKETRWSLAVGTTDMNDDGYTDLFIANDFGRDDWYLNDQGKHFVRQEGVFYGDIGLDTYKGMNASVGDLDGNGKEDIHISNVHHEMQAEGSLVWLNETASKSNELDYKESAQRLNLLNTNRFGWGAAIGDLDLNGWLDLVQANGMVDDIWDKKWEEPHDFWYYQAQIARTEPNIHSYADKWADIRGCYIYPNEQDRISLNLGNGVFIDASDALGFLHTANTRGVALADFDNDGDLDVLVTHQFGDPFLYENELLSKNWIGLEIIGNGSSTNKDAVGTKVVVTHVSEGKEVMQHKEVRLANGFMAMGDNRLLYGFGNQKVFELKIKIKWHNGQEQHLTLKELNSYHKIVQPDEI